MDEQNFLALFADQFDDTDPADIAMNTEFRSLEEWDSMVALMVIAMVDEEFSVKLSGDDIKGANTVSDIFKHASQKS